MPDTFVTVAALGLAWTACGLLLRISRAAERAAVALEEIAGAAEEVASNGALPAVGREPSRN